MSCYHPLKAWNIGALNDTGTIKYKVTSYDSDLTIGYKDATFIEIPCGKCIGCRLQRSADWANRCMLEASKYSENCFITLTYNDDHLPEPVGDSDISSLNKKHFQDFMKRLRDGLGDRKIRFYSCGEYGDKSNRPHYHAIIFNWFPEDAKFLKNNKLGQPLYISDFLDAKWKHGYCFVGHVDWNSAAYVSRYCTKKLSGPASAYYDEKHIIPEFSLMSRRPGIGREYFEDHFDSFKKTHKLIMPARDGSFKEIGSNRYFDSLYDRFDPVSFYEYKKNNKASSEVTRIVKLSNTDLRYLNYLEVEEANFIASTSSLFDFKTI